MKIVQSSVNFAAQYGRQKLQQTEQQTNSSVVNEQQGTQKQRLALSSSAFRSVSSQSSVAEVRHLQTWQNHSQFDRFYIGDLPALNGYKSASRVIPVDSGAYFSYQDNQGINLRIHGEVTLQGGESIQFDFRASASQNFSLQYASGEYAERVSPRKDPLIINYSGGFNNLSDQIYQFDLDGDGVTEGVSFAGSGSGFLALDKNRDGVINNGMELFGAVSGSGFNELAQYDDDGNGFIDSGDRIYDQLLIYEKNEAGEDTLIGLSELQVAAISVESAATPFRIADHFNNELGMARATGVFIRNNGTVGSVQQIDLALRNQVQEAQMKIAFSKDSDQVPESPQKDDADLELENLMAQIQQAKQQRLDRQDQLINDDGNKEPKTLLEQLVDKLEEHIEKQREDNTSDE